jgi:hypothetical protein
VLNIPPGACLLSLLGVVLALSPLPALRVMLAVLVTAAGRWLPDEAREFDQELLHLLRHQPATYRRSFPSHIRLLRGAGIVLLAFGVSAAILGGVA